MDPRLSKVPDIDKPFVGAQPKLLKMPRIADDDAACTHQATNHLATQSRDVCKGLALMFAE